MFKYYSLVLCLVAISSAKTLDKEEDWVAFRAYSQPIFQACGELHGVTPAEFKAAQDNDSMDKINPCFLSCFLKKVKIINDEGFFDFEKKKELISKVLKREEDMTYYISLEKKCVAINDKPVTDGTAGCDRTRMLMICELQDEINRYMIKKLAY